MHKNFIFSILSKNQKEWIKQYRQFVSVEQGDDAGSVLESPKWPAVWEPNEFVDWVKAKYYETKINDEIPRSKSLIPSRAEILKAVCGYYSVHEQDLYMAKRGITNEPRNVSIYLSRWLRRESLDDIGQQFKIKKYSSVSSIIERVKKQNKNDRDFAKRIEEVSVKIIS